MCCAEALERSWHQLGRKDPSPSRLHSGGWRRCHTPTPRLLPTQTRTVSCGLSVSSLLHGDGTMPGLREGRWCTSLPPLPPFYLMPQQLWAGRRFLQNTWLRAGHLVDLSSQYLIVDWFYL